MAFDLDTTVFVLHVVTLAVLYVFLLLVALLVWRDVQGRAQPCGGGRGRAEQTPAGTARLIILDGGDTGLAVGQSLPVFAVTTIGRSPECTVYLSDASVSTTHALITERVGHWWIEDQNSLNGTVLNEAPIEKASLLSSGDVLILGRVRLRFEVVGSAEG